MQDETRILLLPRLQKSHDLQSGPDCFDLEEYLGPSFHNLYFKQLTRGFKTSKAHSHQG